MARRKKTQPYSNTNMNMTLLLILYNYIVREIEKMHTRRRGAQEQERACVTDDEKEDGGAPDSPRATSA